MIVDTHHLPTGQHAIYIPITFSIVWIPNCYQCKIKYIHSSIIVWAFVFADWVRLMATDSGIGNAAHTFVANIQVRTLKPISLS